MQEGMDEIILRNKNTDLQKNWGTSVLQKKVYFFAKASIKKFY